MKLQRSMPSFALLTRLAYFHLPFGDSPKRINDFRKRASQPYMTCAAQTASFYEWGQICHEFEILQSFEPKTGLMPICRAMRKWPECVFPVQTRGHDLPSLQIFVISRFRANLVPFREKQAATRLRRPSPSTSAKTSRISCLAYIRRAGHQTRQGMEDQGHQCLQERKNGKDGEQVKGPE